MIFLLLVDPFSDWGAWDAALRRVEVVRARSPTEMPRKVEEVES